MAWTRPSVAVAVGVAALVVASCAGGSSFRYEKHAASGTYFKVPTSWHAVDTTDLYDTSKSLIGQQTLKQLDWVRSYDSAATPSADHFAIGHATAPTVTVVVRPVLTAERDAFSLDDLRVANGLLPITVDQLRTIRKQEEANMATNPRQQLEVGTFQTLSDAPLLTKGYRGVHYTFVAQLSDDLRQVFDVTAWVDDATTSTRIMLATCSEQCYLRNAGAISTITSSFTVKER